MKRVAAFVVTAGLVSAAIWWSNRKTVVAPDEPESAIWRMLDQSRAGSVDGYLDCFAGAMRAQLETTARAMTRTKFAEYLKESVSRVKGVAVYDVARPAPDTANLVMEYVYQDGNERQRMALRKGGGAWRIEASEASQRIQPLIPYGKPVTEVQ